MAKFAQYAVAAAEMALEDAGWRPKSRDEREVTGVCLGSGIGNLHDLVDATLAYYDGVGTFSAKTRTSAELIRAIKRYPLSSYPSY